MQNKLKPNPIAIIQYVILLGLGERTIYRNHVFLKKN